MCDTTLEGYWQYENMTFFRQAYGMLKYFSSVDVLVDHPFESD